MGSRKKIGLIYKHDENWVGGTYYILNLINSLKYLPKKLQPILTIFIDEIVDFRPIEEVGYRNINYKIIDKYRLSIFKRIFNKIIYVLKIFKPYEWRPTNEYNFIFPNPKGYYFEKTKNKLFWIPDFQHKYHKDIFSVSEILLREKFVLDRINNNETIVFSSKDSEKDFRKFYNVENIKSIVLPFCVFHPNFSDIKIKDILEKYNLEKYFMIKNKFWKHKNHSVVIEAVNKIKNINKFQNIDFVFTGKEFDPRDKYYAEKIKNLIKKYNLDYKIKCLGFIDRKEQLLLMKNSIAVIQPSLFEGWNTSVEDCKLLNKEIILSDIKIHREQINKNVIFFDPNSTDDLINKLIFKLAPKNKVEKLIIRKVYWILVTS